MDQPILAEQLGYDFVSFGDSQMLWAALYAIMARDSSTLNIRYRFALQLPGRRGKLPMASWDGAHEPIAGGQGPLAQGGPATGPLVG